MRQRLLLLAAVTVTLLIGYADAAPRPGFTIPEITLSPDRRLGVLVPGLDRYEAGEKNRLVEVATGRVLASINAEPGMEQMNHGGVAVTRWSSDSSLLLWHVEGKWFPRALVLLKLNEAGVQWQLNLLKRAQEEILARTRKVSPKKYAAAKKANSGNGSAYPDGFTIDVTVPGEADAPISLPLRVDVTLTSNPKAIEDFPPEARLEARLEAEVDPKGNFSVVKFQLD